MLESRDYMRDRYQGYNGNVNASKKMLRGIIILTVTLFVLQQIFPKDFEWVLSLKNQATFDYQNNYFSTPYPSWLVYLGIPGHLLVHADVFHILFNMLSLFWLGQFVIEKLDAKQFLTLYIFSGIFAGLIWFLSVNGQGIIARSVGASTAVSGVFVAAVMIYPNLPFFLGLKLRQLFWVFLALDIAYILTDSRTNGYGHILGMIGGGIYMLIFQRAYIAWTPWGALPRKSKEYKPKFTIHNFETGKQKVADLDAIEISSEVDKILDKISAEGYRSLTKKEKEILEQAGKKLKR
ncbi:MAG: rhomboid family intramembrane serine protease [Lentisphaeria bacterium]|nr:rhomboid family intramembrane serine protease [Lentisphaeria bacterium]